ncbi:MAG: HIT family protein [Nitriliruptorales bacterium]
MSASCAFCRVIAGEQDAHLVHDGPVGVAFLDHRPLFPGHTLVVPRAHRETLRDVPPDGLGDLFALVQAVTEAVETAMESHGSFVAMNNRVSQSVPHLHVHVVPRNPKDGLRGFFWPRNPYEEDDHAAAVAKRVREAIDRVLR